jgi:hypothetical protein
MYLVDIDDKNILCNIILDTIKDLVKWNRGNLVFYMI